MYICIYNTSINRHICIHTCKSLDVDMHANSVLPFSKNFSSAVCLSIHIYPYIYM